MFFVADRIGWFAERQRRASHETPGCRRVEITTRDDDESALGKPRGPIELEVFETSRAMQVDDDGQGIGLLRPVHRRVLDHTVRTCDAQPLRTRHEDLGRGHGRHCEIADARGRCEITRGGGGRRHRRRRSCARGRRLALGLRGRACAQHHDRDHGTDPRMHPAIFASATPSVMVHPLTSANDQRVRGRARRTGDATTPR